MKIKMQLDPEVSSLMVGSLELAEAHRARIEERYSDALQWYQKSVDLGNPRATWELSMLYSEEQWGLIDILGLRSDELLLKAAELGFEPAMMDHSLENQLYNPYESKYYERLIESKDPYVVARLFFFLRDSVRPRDFAERRTAVELYQKAIKAGYSNCYAYVYDTIWQYLSMKEKSEWLLAGASSGDHYLQCELGKVLDIRCKEHGLIFSPNDKEAMYWYLKAVKQLDRSAMKYAQRIYFDKTSECYNRVKGIELVVLSSNLAVRRHLEAVADENDQVLMFDNSSLKVLLNRLRNLASCHLVCEADFKEMWMYGRLVVMFPIIEEVLTSTIYLNTVTLIRKCRVLYFKCTEKARQASLAFLLSWKKSSELWSLNRDVALIVAKKIYDSKSNPQVWLSELDRQTLNVN